MRILRLVHYLSLDVCLGALAYQSFFYHFRFRHQIPFSYQFILFCCVWFVYLLDRIIDLRLDLIKDNRHQFIFKHRKSLFYLFVVLGVFVIYLLPKMPLIFLFQGCILFFLVILYWFFWSQKWFNRWFTKEMVTAIIYTFGIVFPVDLNQTLAFYSLVLLFFLLVFYHIKLFLHFSGKKCFTFLWMVELLIILIILFTYILGLINLINLIPILITLGVQLIIHYFYPTIRIRLIAEMAYWSPILLMIYELF